MNDESRKTKRKTRCYIICAVILIIVSIAAIEVVYQVHFKYTGKFRYMISITFLTKRAYKRYWARGKFSQINVGKLIVLT